MTNVPYQDWKIALHVKLGWYISASLLPAISKLWSLHCGLLRQGLLDSLSCIGMIYSVRSVCVFLKSLSIFWIVKFLDWNAIKNLMLWLYLRYNVHLPEAYILNPIDNGLIVTNHHSIRVILWLKWFFSSHGHGSGPFFGSWIY